MAKRPRRRSPGRIPVTTGGARKSRARALAVDRAKAAAARSSAAKAGWITRRANTKKAERAAARARAARSSKSTAARSSKSTAARSSKSTAARSSAAKAGWITRRANAKKAAKAAAKRESRASEPSREFAVSADYKRRNRTGRSLSIQIALRAPANATKEDLQEAINYAINHDGQAPAGYEVAIVDWKGAQYTGGLVQNKTEDAWTRLSAPLALARTAIRTVRGTEI